MQIRIVRPSAPMNKCVPEMDETIDIVSVSWDFQVSVSVSVSIFHIPGSQYQYRFFSYLGISLSLNIENFHILSFIISHGTNSNLLWRKSFVSVSKIMIFKSHSLDIEMLESQV